MLKNPYTNVLNSSIITDEDENSRSSVPSLEPIRPQREHSFNTIDKFENSADTNSRSFGSQGHEIMIYNEGGRRVQPPPPEIKDVSIFQNQNETTPSTQN